MAPRQLRKTRRGFTQIELVVYCSLAVVVLGVAVMFFVRGRRSYEATSQSYLVSADTEATLRSLRADFMSTTLGTVVAYPNQAHTAEPAGVSMMSAVDAKTDKFTINEYGAPAWSKHVFYTVVPGSEGTGDLVRWEQPYTETGYKGVPLPATDVLPSAQTDKTNRRVLLHGVALPTSTLPGAKDALGTGGGFRVTFVRSDTTSGEIKSERPGESLSTYNPADVTRGAATNLTFKENTRLVDVRLILVMPRSSTGQATVAVLPFRVCPRN